MNAPTRISLIALALLGGLLLERLWPARAGQRGEWLTNLGVFAVWSVAVALTGPATAIVETALVNDVGGGLIDLRPWPWPVGAAAYLAAMDLGEYLFHRAQHRFSWLWAMHSLHHSDRGMNVSTTQRHFWLDPALKSVSVWLVVSLLLRADPVILGVYFVAGLNNLIAHANIRMGFGPLGWLWTSPQYHRLHHSTDPAHYNANFAALLPIWDLMSGAYHRPAAGEFPPTGLDEAPQGPLDVVLWPLRGLIRHPPSPIA